MTIENSCENFKQPISLEELSPNLSESFLNGSGNLEIVFYSINRKITVISPTGTGIDLDPDRYSELMVTKGCWYLKLRHLVL